MTLARGYHEPRARISQAIRALLASPNVAVNRPAAEAGLELLDAGGDFAYEGRWLGADEFVSFDRDAVTRLTALGEPARMAG